MANETTFAITHQVNMKASDQRQPRREEVCGSEIQRPKPFTNIPAQQNRLLDMANRVDSPAVVDFEEDNGDTIIVQASQVPCRRLYSDGRPSQMQHEESRPQKKQKLSHPYLHQSVDSNHRPIGLIEQVERSDEHSPDDSRNPDLKLKPTGEDNAHPETTAGKVRDRATETLAEPASPMFYTDFFDAVIDRQGLENRELKESLNSSLTEIENLKGENNAVGKVVRHLRRKILDLSLELSRLRKNNRSSICNKSVHHRENAVSTEQHNMKTGTAGPTLQLARQIKDRETRCGHKTLESASLATREKQPLNRHNVLDQRLSASVSGCETLNKHAQCDGDFGKRGVILASRLDGQETELAQVRHQLFTFQQEIRSYVSLLRQKEKELGLSYQERTRVLRTLDETRQELLISQQGQTDSRVLLEQMQEKLVVAQQEQQKTRDLLGKTQEQLRACLKRERKSAANVPEIPSSDQDHEETRRRLGCSQKKARELKQKLEACEKQSQNHYVLRKMLEHDLLCSKEVLESVKARLSTSEAALKSCCCKDIKSGVLQGTRVTLERDLVQSKVVAESFRHFNNSLTNANSILTTEVDGLKKEVAQSQ